MKNRRPYIRSIPIVWFFFRRIIVISLLTTVSALHFIVMYGPGVYGIIFWFKLIVLLLSLYLINAYHKNEYLYYHNLGISKLRIWLSACTFDFLIFILLYIVVRLML